MENKRNEKKPTYYDNLKETIITIDPPTEEYPIFLIANFKDYGYCVYKELEKDESPNIVENNIPKEKQIIHMEYPNENYEVSIKSFYLVKAKLDSPVNCIELINKMWD
uniref:hypothetical protein n=1 Tax=Aeromonas sp. Ne-1 TaxID=1675689 RepID=UPI0015676EBF|nr:hypothetical protein [Aeromonas sp. Ne-1]